MQFPELSYANERQKPLKRWFIRTVETLSGRRRYARLYGIWRRDIAPSGERIFGRMLELIDVRLACEGAWPPKAVPAGPLVMLANHPFGIGDGIAILSMAEQLGRPFRVMINAELLKISEMAPYSLPVDFDETKEALKNNLAVRHEAMRLLKDGTVIVIFPAGGVATAPGGFGKAVDLPWKLFPARLVQDARATVLPVYFAGQNGRTFHLASRLSLTIRISLLIREFAKLSGREIGARVGEPLVWDDLAAHSGRKELTARLHKAVFDLAPAGHVKRRFRRALAA